MEIKMIIEIANTNEFKRVRIKKVSHNLCNQIIH